MLRFKLYLLFCLPMFYAQHSRHAAVLGGPSKTQPEADMVLIPGGEFDMGDVLGDREKHDETVHAVHVDDFYLGKTELTFAEYDAFCSAVGKPCPVDSSWGRGTRPVMHVSWYDAVAYCNWLSEQQNLGKVYTILGDSVIADWRADGYRLPTEAEWEYAARQGGQNLRFGHGKYFADPAELNIDGRNLDKRRYATAGENRRRTLPVGSFAPNSLGLYDMSGNVWEWCWDWYGLDYYETGVSRNPCGPETGLERVLRGGSWKSGAEGARLAFRGISGPMYKGGGGGFRVARRG